MPHPPGAQTGAFANAWPTMSSAACFGRCECTIAPFLVPEFVMKSIWVKRSFTKGLAPGNATNCLLPKSVYPGVGPCSHTSNRPSLSVSSTGTPRITAPHDTHPLLVAAGFTDVVADASPTFRGAAGA